MMQPRAQTPQLSAKLPASSGTHGKSVLVALYGPHAQSSIYHLARELTMTRQLAGKISRMSSKDSDIAVSLQAQVNDTITRIGRFMVEADLESLRKFTKAAVEMEHPGLIADPTRLVLLEQHEQITIRLQRCPTVGELRAAAEKLNPALQSMEDSQFRRTCRKLELEFNDQKKLEKLRREHRSLTKKLGTTPTHAEFMRAATELKLLPDNFSLKDFGTMCEADGLVFRTA